MTALRFHTGESHQTSPASLRGIALKLVALAKSSLDHTAAGVHLTLSGLWWECYGLCQRHKPTELTHSFWLCSRVYFSLYGPFNCVLSWQLSVFSLCSSCLISALLILSTIYLFMKVSFSPDMVLCGWLGSKHQLTSCEDRVGVGWGGKRDKIPMWHIACQLQPHRERPHTKKIFQL